jgi:hypothetical protein
MALSTQRQVTRLPADALSFTYSASPEAIGFNFLEKVDFLYCYRHNAGQPSRLRLHERPRAADESEGSLEALIPARR